MLAWTIYWWQGFNSIGCFLLCKNKLRCFQSLNISVDVAKCVENVHTLIHYTHFWTVTKNDLSSLNNLFMARFQLISMSTYVKNKLQMCSVTQNISVDDAKSVENVHKFTQYTHFLSVTKNYLSWLNNLFMARFQLISMSSYAKNKLQMFSVTQHQCRRRQMCGKCSHNSLHSLFVCYKKMTCPDWTIYSWQGFNSLGCPLMLRTNYRCVQSLNISVDAAKCVENVHKFTQYTHFLSVNKKWLVLIEQSIHGKVSTQ